MTTQYEATDWLIRDYTPMWLDRAGLNADAAQLRGLPPIIDMDAWLAMEEAALPLISSAAAAAMQAAGAFDKLLGRQGPRGETEPDRAAEAAFRDDEAAQAALRSIRPEDVYDVRVGAYKAAMIAYDTVVPFAARATFRKQFFADKEAED